MKARKWRARRPKRVAQRRCGMFDVSARTDNSGLAIGDDGFRKKHRRLAHEQFSGFGAIGDKLQQVFGSLACQRVLDNGARGGARDRGVVYARKRSSPEESQMKQKAYWIASSSCSASMAADIL
ncbi:MULTISPECIES: hypothetical protein [unclassified Mesorhizobium]|uniref:hypothetical protein n=1 Tax=unclassified Mesorhizobium TaxID=325217 RepID=UPI001FED4063|nr:MULTISPECIES: hypothetical protein [unclassified Mesorhizobium]